MLGSKIVTFRPRFGVGKCCGEAAAAGPVATTTSVATTPSASARKQEAKRLRGWGVMRFVLSAGRTASLQDSVRALAVYTGYFKSWKK
jgi:hypothetical protein